MEGPELGGEQQFCLRWNNFQANITSQFEALRDDEDFVDVTLACEGHRLEAHKVVLSACSPYFKELFKSNPCPHPIIFMRDCELIHITALLEFMYAGEVNIAQAQLTSFLRTAEALQIRGLTDSSDKNKTEFKNTSSKLHSSQLRNLLCGRLRQSNSPAKDSSQNIESNDNFQKTAKHSGQSRKVSRTENDCSNAITPHNGMPESHLYSLARSGTNNNCEMKDDALRLKENSMLNNQEDENFPYNMGENNLLMLNETDNLSSGKINPFAVGGVGFGGLNSEFPHEMIEPKLEVPDYTSEDEMRQERTFNPEILFGTDASAQLSNPFLNIQGDNTAGTSQDIKSEMEAVGRAAGSGRVCCPECGRRYSNLSNLRQHVRLIHRSQPVACPLCARTFKTPLYLRRHTLSQHADYARTQQDRTVKTELLGQHTDYARAQQERTPTRGSIPIANNTILKVKTELLIDNSSEIAKIDSNDCENEGANGYDIHNGDVSSESVDPDALKIDDQEMAEGDT